MAGFQKYIVMGNLTREPETRYTQSGMAVCEFTIAVNGTRKEDKTFFGRVVVFGKTAESCQKYLGKGSTVMIEGRLTNDEWEDRQTGQKREKTRIIAENVQFIGSGASTRQSEQSGPNYGAQEPSRRYQQEDCPPPMPPPPPGIPAQGENSDIPF